MVDLRKAAMSLLGCALERLPFPRSLATNSWNTGIPESEAERTQRLARKRADLASDLARMDGIEASQVYDGLQDRPAVAPPRPIYRHGKQGFVDKLAMVARAGDGGNGCVSFVSKYRWEGLSFCSCYPSGIS